tara:strand:- start:523 stop:765 length:243 start_codon:yes stop_codon:yes gene_type:complete
MSNNNKGFDDTRSMTKLKMTAYKGLSVADNCTEFRDSSGPSFPEISKAMDGLREAPMDGLVAVSGKDGPDGSYNKAEVAW